MPAGSGRTAISISMDENRLTDEERARLARGWWPSKLTQREYAAKHGINERTLRAWLRCWAMTLPADPDVPLEMRDRAIGPLRVLAPEFKRFFTVIDEVTRLLRMACASSAKLTE